MTNIFTGKTCIIVTMHGKEHIIGPLLQHHLSIKSIPTTMVNTDMFGTFSGDKKRIGTPRDSASAKITTAQKNIVGELYLASEGTFGPHPVYGHLVANCEYILMYDNISKRYYKGHAISLHTHCAEQAINHVDEGMNFALVYDFPRHGIIVKTIDQNDTILSVYKDIEDIDLLYTTLTSLFSNNQKIIIETDMRAHKNPTRCNTIHLATQHLIETIQNCCPQCQSPGFAITTYVAGLPCSLCHAPTRLPKAHIYTCDVCHYAQEVPIEQKEYADPGQCSHCNP